MSLSHHFVLAYYNIFHAIGFSFVQDEDMRVVLQYVVSAWHAYEGCSCEESRAARLSVLNSDGTTSETVVVSAGPDGAQCVPSQDWAGAVSTDVAGMKEGLIKVVTGECGPMDALMAGLIQCSDLMAMAEFSRWFKFSPEDFAVFKSRTEHEMQATHAPTLSVAKPHLSISDTTKFANSLSDLSLGDAVACFEAAWIPISEMSNPTPTPFTLKLCGDSPYSDTPLLRFSFSMSGDALYICEALDESDVVEVTRFDFLGWLIDQALPGDYPPLQSNFPAALSDFLSHISYTKLPIAYEERLSRRALVLAQQFDHIAGDAVPQSSISLSPAARGIGLLEAFGRPTRRAVGQFFTIRFMDVGNLSVDVLLDAIGAIHCAVRNDQVPWDGELNSRRPEWCGEISLSIDTLDGLIHRTVRLDEAVTDGDVDWEARNPEVIHDMFAPEVSQDIWYVYYIL